MHNNILYTKNISCPVCSKEFSTTKVRLSACRIEKRDSDFCTYYKDINPMFYEVYVCPYCGYAAVERRFSDIDTAGKRAILENISRYWSKRDYGGERTLAQALECFKLALLCSQIKKDRPVGVAGLCLRIAWLYRFMGNSGEESRFMQAALDNYMFAFQRQMNDEGMDEINLLYIIGELQRRLGNVAQAVQWFSRVISHKDRDNNPMIVSMAREQWQSIRENKVNDA